MQPGLIARAGHVRTGSSPSALQRLSEHSWFWVPVAGAVALVAGALPLVTPVSGLLLPVAVVATAVVARWPTAATVVALILCQEISPTSGFGLNASAIQVFGNDLYLEEVGGVPILVYVLALAAVAGMLHAHGRPDGGERVLVGACLTVGVCGLVIVAVSSHHGADLVTAVGKHGRPYLVAVLALIVVSTTGRQPGGWRLVLRSGSVALVAVLLGGLALLLSGGAAPEVDGALSVYYDSALPALAGAVLLVPLIGFVKGGWWWTLLVVAAMIVLLSGRRNVWAAVVLTLVVILAVRGGRARAALRLGVAGVLLVVAALLASPELVASVGERATAAATTLVTGSGEASTAGHIDDIRYGFGYALNGPWLGLGPNHEPLPGMSVQSGTLYVHNTYILDWLRFGVPGLLVLTTLTAFMLVIAMRRLRLPDMPPAAAVGAMFLMIAPWCAMTAAFFTTTARWPTLLGLAAGALLSSPRRPASDGAATASRPTPDSRTAARRDHERTRTR